MHERLLQLERLVKSIASKPDSSSDLDFNQPATPPRGVTPIDCCSDSGSMHVTTSELHYIGADHWAAIADTIADLKYHYDREEQLRRATNLGPIQGDAGDAGNHVDNYPRAHSLLLYGGRLPASQAEILTALPPKTAVDRYISRYFNCQELVSCECLANTV